MENTTCEHEEEIENLTYRFKTDEYIKGLESRLLHLANTKTKNVMVVTNDNAFVRWEPYGEYQQLADMIMKERQEYIDNKYAKLFQ